MLKKLRIGPKLLLAPGLVLILLVLTAGSAYYGMVRQNTSLENMVQVRAARLKAAADVSGEAKYAHANIYQLLAWISGSFAQARLDALIADLKRKHAAIATELAALAAISDPAERKIIDASIGALEAYRKSVKSTIELAQVDQSLGANSMNTAEKQFVALNDQLARLSALEKSLSEQAYAAAKAEFRRQGLAMAALVLLSIGLSLVVTMLVRRAMLTDIRAISNVVGELADGRLSTLVASDGRDEIADTSRALDHTIATLNTTLRTILDSVRSIDTASQEIASGNLDLSTRTEMQAGSLEQTASAMESLTVAVKDNANNARLATELAAEAAKLAADGGQAVNRAVTTMESIKASSRKIVEIIGVIDSISFQTNILALNAAVEAARAGEQGRGFAVVAAEVRTLAQRSAAAAKEIKALIASSVAIIDGGSASVNAAGASMGHIVASVRQVNDIIERISVASSEQAEGIAEVNNAVGLMDDMTQQNAALVEQAAAAAESLHDQTVNLAKAVSVFQVEDGAPAAGPSRPRAHGEQAQSDESDDLGDFADPHERRAPDSPMRGRPALVDDSGAAHQRQHGA
jgi:methyl-accepting chemotaxis protein